MTKRLSIDVEAMVGQVFGRLTLLSISLHGSVGAARGVFKCECGTIKDVRIYSVYKGVVKSCGCIQREWITELGRVNNATHRMSKTKPWNCWAEMCRRDKRAKEGKYVEIEIYPEWRESFGAFYEHIGEYPENTSEEWSIDRIDNDLGYVPGNVRWATRAQQARNKGKYKNNNTGVTGVVYRAQSGRSPRFIAQWKDLDLKQHTKSFTVSVHGEDIAFNLAVEYRKAKIEELNMLGAGYSDKHGQ